MVASSRQSPACTHSTTYADFWAASRRWTSVKAHAAASADPSRLHPQCSGSARRTASSGSPPCGSPQAEQEVSLASSKERTWCRGFGASGALFGYSISCGLYSNCTWCRFSVLPAIHRVPMLFCCIRTREMAFAVYDTEYAWIHGGNSASGNTAPTLCCDVLAELTPLRLESLRSPGSPGTIILPPSLLGLTTLSASSSVYFASQASGHTQQGLGHSIQNQSPPRLVGVLRRAGEPGPAAGSQGLGPMGTPPRAHVSTGEESASKLPRSAGLLKRVRHVSSVLGFKGNPGHTCRQLLRPSRACSCGPARSAALIHLQFKFVLSSCNERGRLESMRSSVTACCPPVRRRGIGYRVKSVSQVHAHGLTGAGRTRDDCTAPVELTKHGHVALLPVFSNTTCLAWPSLSPTVL